MFRAPVSDIPATKNNRATLGIVFLTLFIDMIGFGIVIPVLPLYANAEPFFASEMQLAWVVGIYSLLQFIFSPVIGKISDRFGRRPVLAVSIIGTAVGFLVLGTATTVTMLLVGRIIDGISGGNISTAMACIADSTTREERSRAMGLVGAAFGLGFVIGPALGGVLSMISHSTPFYVAAVMALINAILVITRMPETLTPEIRARNKKSVPLGELFTHGSSRNVVLSLVSQFAGVTGFSVMTSMFAIYCSVRYGYDGRGVGLVLSYVGVLGAVMQGGVVRRMLKRPIEKPLAIIGTAILAVSMAGLAMLNPDRNWTGLTMLLIVCAGISIGNSLSTPSLNGLASRSVDAHCQGRLMGMMQGAGALGRFVGPLIGYALVQFDPSPSHYGRVAFLAAAALLAIDCLLLLGLNAPPHSSKEPEPAPAA